MAATEVSTEGKNALLQTGWTSKVNYARLYTSSDVLVDTQAITLTHTAGTAIMHPSADIVFEVAASTSNVSYIVIGFESTPISTTIYVPYYTRLLSTEYDFATEGTLTVDSFDITVSGTSLNTDGLDAIITTGLDQLVTAKLFSTTSTLMNTQTVSFSVTGGVMSLDADIVFDVASGTAEFIELLDGTPDTLYVRTLATTYEFATAGTLTVDTWTITI